MYEERILYGLDKIHYCKKNDGIIKPILGAINIEIILRQDCKWMKINGHDAIKFNAPIRGTGELTVMGLTLEEKADLLGYEYQNGELVVSDNPFQPHVSLLFARQLESSGELYTVCYNCVFENTNINSTTCEEEDKDETLTLKFDVLVDLDIKATGITLNTKIANKDKVNNFFKFIQLPEKAMRR